MTILISIALLLIAINTTLNSINNRKIKKQIKDIADNQFDAEQVMELYAMKYAPKPQIIKETLNVFPLYAYYDLPYDKEDCVTEEEIKKYLADEIRNQIEEYMEVESEHDIVRWSTQYRARLKVVK